MSTKCIMNRVIFRGTKAQYEDDIAHRVFDNFVDAFNWLHKYLDNRQEVFEVEEWFRVGFLDEQISLSNWDDDNDYWYTEVYSVELVG